jgi:hypothetical protein
VNRAQPQFPTLLTTLIPLPIPHPTQGIVPTAPYYVQHSNQIACTSQRVDRPTNCGSCCPCVHHQPLMLGLVADHSLSAFRFVEDANQKYTRSAKRTLRRRRWPATYAPTVFVDCRCDQSTTVGTTSMHSAKLVAHSRDMLRAVYRAPVAHIPIASAPGTLRSRIRFTPHHAMTNDEILV